MIRHCDFLVIVVAYFIISVVYRIDSKADHQQVIANSNRNYKEKEFTSCDANLPRLLNDDTEAIEGVDNCCSIHRMCQSFIPPQTTLYGITNNKTTKLFSCPCEAEFRICLINLYYNTRNSLIVEVGRMYFNDHQPLCFLMLYKKNCEHKKFYNLKNQTFDENEEERNFCAKVYEQRFF